MEVLLLICGIIVGYFTRYVVENKHVGGKLRIDRSDSDDTPYLFLELNKESEDLLFLGKRQCIRFKVEHEDFITQK